MPSSKWITDQDADDATVGVTSRLNFIGEAAVFLDILRFIYRVACCEAPVLLQGETGTGKELAASAIHYLSARRNGPFIPVNCGAIPDTLIESELFGHVRGAFTDAKEPRQGVVGQARGGTLFLDELEVISHRGQVALLRFLQDQRYCPIGGAAAKKGDVRVIGASNTDLAKLAARGEFRQDLLFRLNVLICQLPPLRARGDDVLLLAARFQIAIAGSTTSPPSSSPPRRSRLYAPIRGRATCVSWRTSSTARWCLPTRCLSSLQTCNPFRLISVIAHVPRSAKSLFKRRKRSR